MRIAIVLLAFVAFSAAEEEIQPFASISDKVIEIIEDIRDQMPCGFDSMGIPPLAPLEISHREIAFDTEYLKASGSVHSFILNGLNDFTVNEMKVNMFLQKATFRFTFENINVDTLYDMDILLKKSGITGILKGNGQAKFAVKDIVINGVAKFSVSISQKMKLKSLDMRIKIGEVESEIEGILGEGKINRKMNVVLEGLVKNMVNSNEDMIAQKIEEIVVPKVNKFLAGNKMSQLTINAGAKKEACNPAK